MKTDDKSPAVKGDEAERVAECEPGVLSMYAVPIIAIALLVIAGALVHMVAP